MRVLVTFAVEAEFAHWRKLRKFRYIDYLGLRLWRTDFGNHEITVLLTGVGEQAAAQAMDLMLRMADDEKYFDVCISSGLAGALDALLVPGDIVAPRMVRAVFRRADVNYESLTVDEKLHQFALSRGAKATECLFSSDRLLLTTQQKQDCGCSTKAQLVDMESFEIVKEACAWGARTVIVRAVSDAAGEDLPINFSVALTEKSQISVGKILLQLMKKPQVLPALIRFGKQSRLAAEALANYLDSYISGLCDVHSQESAIRAAAK